MRPPAKTMYIGLDACDLHVAQQFAADGDMPTLAGLLGTAAVVETVGPVGFFVGANWPTIYTGTTPSRHGFLCAARVPGGEYVAQWVEGPAEETPPIWEHLSNAGKRVASLDAPHARVARDLNGIQLVEWGCHDRHGGTRSYPAEFVDEVNAKYGGHLLDLVGHEMPHVGSVRLVAPCRRGSHSRGGCRAACRSRGRPPPEGRAVARRAGSRRLGLVLHGARRDALRRAPVLAPA